MFEPFMKNNFYDKDFQKTSEKEFRIEKVIKKKAINHMLNGKDTIICSTIRLIKDSINEWTFSKKNKSLGGNVKIELNLCNYATKADLEIETGVDTTDFSKRLIWLRIRYW